VKPEGGQSQTEPQGSGDLMQRTARKSVAQELFLILSYSINLASKEIYKVIRDVLFGNV